MLSIHRYVCDGAWPTAVPPLAGAGSPLTRRQANVDVNARMGNAEAAVARASHRLERMAASDIFAELHERRLRMTQRVGELAQGLWDARMLRRAAAFYATAFSALGSKAGSAVTVPVRARREGAYYDTYGGVFVLRSEYVRSHWSRFSRTHVGAGLSSEEAVVFPVLRMPSIYRTKTRTHVETWAAVVQDALVLTDEWRTLLWWDFLLGEGDELYMDASTGTPFDLEFDRMVLQTLARTCDPMTLVRARMGPRGRDSRTSSGEIRGHRAMFGVLATSDEATEHTRDLAREVSKLIDIVAPILEDLPDDYHTKYFTDVQAFAAPMPTVYVVTQEVSGVKSDSMGAMSLSVGGWVHMLRQVFGPYTMSEDGEDDGCPLLATAVTVSGSAPQVYPGDKVWELEVNQIEATYELQDASRDTIEAHAMVNGHVAGMD